MWFFTFSTKTQIDLSHGVCMIGGVLCSFTFTRVCGILFATARKWSILPLRSARKMKKERGGRIFEGF